MTYIINHKLIKTEDGYIVELYLDQQLNEFSLEFLGIRKNGSDSEATNNLEKAVEDYIKEKLPEFKINTVRIILGALLVASIPFGNVHASGEPMPHSFEAQTTSTVSAQTATTSTVPAQTATTSTVPAQTATTYTVKSGDTLYLISKKFNITVTQLKEANGLKSDSINVSQQLQITTTPKVVYRVLSGDTLYAISKKFNISIVQLKSENGLTSDMLKIGQTLKIPYIVSNPSNILVLVNKSNNLTLNYVPVNLVVPNVTFSFQEYSEKKLMRQDAATALEEMFKVAKSSGINLYAVSGYRSYATQSSIFASNVIKYGSIENANQFSAKPGQSEHQTGLAMDITSSSVNYGLSQSFGDTKEGKWLSENAYKYGFILRYGQGKETITGYQYEPWHFRYVGKEAAKELYSRVITLEQYTLNPH